MSWTIEFDEIGNRTVHTKGINRVDGIEYRTEITIVEDDTVTKERVVSDSEYDAVEFHQKVVEVFTAIVAMRYATGKDE